MHQVMILEDGSGIVLVHFTYRGSLGAIVSKNISLGGKEVWKVACAPALRELSSLPDRPGPWHRSSDPRAVTCPLCKKTEAYQQAALETEAAVRSMRISV